MKNKHQYKCAICKKNFTSHNPKPTYCSFECRVKNQTTNISFEEARRMYEEGKSQEEVSIELNVTRKVIYNLFKRNNYKCRVAAKRNQNRSDNDSWKGNNVTYAALHYRVSALKGKPKKCEICGTVDENKMYNWACIGDYYNTDDYKRMCRSCHSKQDKIGDNFPNHNVDRKSLRSHIPLKCKKK